MEKSCEIRLVDFGSLKALVSVRFGDMEIRGFKVIEQDNAGAWVAPPSREIHRDGKKEYYNIVRFCEDDAKTDFNNWILKAYHQQTNGNGNRRN